MSNRKRKKPLPPTLSNTGFIGATFADTNELLANEYHFSRKQMKITHHVLDALLQGVTQLFQQHNVEAALSCVYLPKYKKIGLVLSKQPFGRREGIGYFINYLKEVGHIDWDEKTKDYEIHNTSFIGVVFADLEKISKFTFEFELQLLAKFVKELIIPAKELFLQHHIRAYISGVENDEQHKLGFVLSIKPYDERKEADLYFVEYLKERGLYEADESEEELIPIHTKWSLFSK
ncbi:hypothetical protein CHN50_02885 [Priestia aryabhattai]|uniref:hypothetical protein n=1 Tax=Bacillaceae TaxID=186817 RepID=UPI000BA17D8E|nr:MULTISPECIES: hypothetical protein [Bacillaceae]MDT2046870.1 hypothetical protein [Priestia flexa]OZT14526.1 hypothetical protein CHN50_02885 [Priestia aryabhattai]TDB49458.1 hypothetical protein EPL02_10020 [Bacillus sp. CBEL-1]USY56990.1 hypothetical protein NIZ91_10185 [Bacillus sp. 1780r2a1]